MNYQYLDHFSVVFVQHWWMEAFPAASERLDQGGPTTFFKPDNRLKNFGFGSPTHTTYYVTVIVVSSRIFDRRTPCILCIGMSYHVCI